VDPGFFRLGLSTYFVGKLEQNQVMQIMESDAFKEAEGWIEKGMDYVIEHGPNVLWAILIYVIGSWLVKRIIRGLRKVMQKSNYDVSLQRFLMNLISWLLKIVLIILVVSRLGVDVTMFAAIFAAAGLAVGLALQGSLSNFAGGVLIAIFKPYRIGDLVETQDILGVVKDIDIFTTKMVTPQNKLAIVPNGPIANGNIINYTVEGKMRVDIVVGVAYEEDIKKSKDVLLGVLTSNPKVLQDPPPSVNVLELAESSVNFAVRPFCKPEDYWDVYFATQEGCKLALDDAGIEIPYPHSVEIHKEG
jgi:small conductance mechanosensitive channel